MKKVMFLTLVITTMMMSICFANPVEAASIPADFLTAPVKYTISLRAVMPTNTITFNGFVIGEEEIVADMENWKAL